MLGYTASSHAEDTMRRVGVTHRYLDGIQIQDYDRLRFIEKFPDSCGITYRLAYTFRICLALSRTPKLTFTIDP